MEGLAAPTPSPPLEIRNGISSMGNGLQPSQSIDARLLEPRGLSPINIARRGFHEKPRLAIFQTPVEIVQECNFAGDQSIALEPFKV